MNRDPKMTSAKNDVRHKGNSIKVLPSFQNVFSTNIDHSTDVPREVGTVKIIMENLKFNL